MVLRNEERMANFMDGFLPGMKAQGTMPMVNSGFAAVVLPGEEFTPMPRPTLWFSSTLTVAAS
jgi:hypothetical protein